VKNPMKLKDRIALITGGASGIGLATAIAFLEEGAKVAIADISEENGRRALELIDKKGHNVLFIKADISKEVDARRIIDETVAKFGKLDILFNNAGIWIDKKVEDLEVEEWDRIMDINLKGVFLCSKYAVPQMRTQGKGVIVNNSSCNGLVGDYGDPAYCASKGGVALLTKAMALDYARENIRVNAICCGEIETQMFLEEARVNRMSVEEYRKEVASAHPMGRIGTPEEAANAVLFLACDDSSFITGTLLSVDGGLTAI